MTKLSIEDFESRKVTSRSIKKPLHGVGINDVDFVIGIRVDGKET